MIFGNDDLDKTKKVVDEVIEAVGKTIKNGTLPPEEYSKTIVAFTDLISVRAEID